MRVGMSPKVYITKTIKDDGDEHVIMSYFDDGMCFASVLGCIVQYGEDPQKGDMRVFHDHASALNYAKNRARKDLGRDDIDFLDREPNQPKIVQRPQSSQLYRV